MVRRLWAAVLAAGICSSLCFGQGVQDLPREADYRGEIRRGADGKLMVVPSRPASQPNQISEAKATMVVGPGERVQTITEAARIARDGEVIEIRPGDYRRQPAIWTQNNLVIRGLGERPVMIADGTNAEGKAIWVVRGGRIRIENVEFRGARVPDGNGAGIRFEKGHLSLKRCAFFDNEMGLLTANEESMSLEISDSEFGSAPTHPGQLHHLLYVGTIGKFTLSGSHFFGGFLGHLVKSRARESHVLYNMLVDGAEGRAGYELEFPNGGMAYVVGNSIGQSAQSDNPVIVAYGTEGRRWPDNALYFVHNTLLNDAENGTFLRIWADNFPIGAEAWVVNNLMVGQGILAPIGRGRFEGNVRADKVDLIRVGGVPLRLTTSHPLRGTIRMPGSARGFDLAPSAEFVYPVGTRSISLSNALAPGAFQ